MTMGRMGWMNQNARLDATYGRLGRNDGYLVSVIPRTDYTFDPRVSGANSVIPLVVGVDSSSWVSGMLLVRLHARSAWATGVQAKVIVQNIMLTPDEPDVIFAPATLATSVAQVQIDNSTNAPLLLTAAMTNMSAMLRVVIELVPGSSTGVNTFSVGVDLVGRPA